MKQNDAMAGFLQLKKHFALDICTAGSAMHSRTQYQTELVYFNTILFTYKPDDRPEAVFSACMKYE